MTDEADKMNVPMIAAIAALVSTPVSAIRLTDRQLIAKTDALEDECRGTYNSRTDAVCARVEALMEQLGKRGWCWGPDDAIEADKMWMRAGRTCHP